ALIRRAAHGRAIDAGAHPVAMLVGLHGAGAGRTARDASPGLLARARAVAEPVIATRRHKSATAGFGVAARGNGSAEAVARAAVQRRGAGVAAARARILAAHAVDAEAGGAIAGRAAVLALAAIGAAR